MHLTTSAIILGVPALILLAGCTSTAPHYRFSPVPAAGQFVTFSDGIPFVFSQQVNVVSVSLPPDGTSLDSEFTPIGISLANFDDRAHVVDANNVQISSDNPKLRIVPPTEIKDRINSRAAWARFANAFAAAANMAAASMPKTTTYSGSAFGTGGYVAYSGSVTTYDPASTAAANAAISRQQLEGDREIENTRRTLVDEYSNGIRRHTLYPNDTYLGVVYVESKVLRRASRVHLTIEFAKETHVFEVDFSREGVPGTNYDYSSPVLAPAVDRKAGNVRAPEPSTEPMAFEPTKVADSLSKNQRITFETKDGRRFYAARIIEIAPDYLIVSTIDGVFTLRREELPDELAKRLPLPAGQTRA